MKILSIVGARPQFVKLAPFSRALADSNCQPRIEHIIVHTGQHYDAAMSAIFFEQLEIPPPDFNLGVGSGLQGQQTGRMIEQIESLLLTQKPDVVLVFGDTNSTLAGALAAVKLHLPVAHIEAGLRSHNRQMPEEINRIVADHVADLLLAPTPEAMQNLARENLAQRAVNVGDLMYDAVLYNRELALQRSTICQELGLTDNAYGVVTVHRADNTTSERIRMLAEALNAIAAEGLRLVFPIHPRTRKALFEAIPNFTPHAHLTLIEPLGYLDMLQLVDKAALIITDSGGVQREAFFLNRPCITVRDETEWPETVAAKANVLTGVVGEKIQAAVNAWQAQPSYDFNAQVQSYFGDGQAAQRILHALQEFSVPGTFNRN